MSTRTYRTWAERRAARNDPNRRRAPRIYPIDSLARALGINPEDPMLKSRLANALHLEPSWVRRCLQDEPMLTAQAADHWAARAGLHADIVWPGWEDDPATDDLDPLPGEDDPPIDECEPISPERLAQLRMAWRAAA